MTGGRQLSNPEKMGWGKICMNVDDSPFTTHLGSYANVVMTFILQPSTPGVRTPKHVNPVGSFARRTRAELLPQFNVFADAENQGGNAPVFAPPAHLHRGHVHIRRVCRTFTPLR